MLCRRRESSVTTGSRVAVVGGRVEPDCRSKRMLAVRKYKQSELGGDKTRKGQGIQV